MTPSQPRFRWQRIRRHFIRFTWGGPWAAVLAPEKRTNLTLFFFDGLFAAASDRIILTYLTIYFLALGASRQQIGLLSSVSNLTAALMLLPAAMLVERSGQRKRVTLTAAAGSRLVVLLLALLPFFIPNTSLLIWIVLGLSLVRDALNNVGFPGWIALTGDIIPLEGRGRYFGTRNLVMGIAGIITALSIGKAITTLGEPLGYQLSLILAVVLGLVSMHFFSRIKDPQTSDSAIEQVRTSLREILTSLKGQRPFILYCLVTAVWNFSINIAGPFFNVFMVDTLKFTAAMIGVISVANTIANLIIQRRVGAWADELGNRRVQLISMLLIPILPMLWGVWVRSYWQAILANVLGGFIWGAYNLVSFNTLLVYTPESQRARFSAFFQIVVTLSLAGGAALGSSLIPMIDFKGVALLSTAGRWLAGILFLLLVRENLTQKPSEEKNQAKSQS
jgi:MFS family permease